MTDPTPATRQEPRTEAGRRVVTFSTVAGVDIRNWRGYPAEVIAIEDEARAAVLPLLTEVGFLRSVIASGERLSDEDNARINAVLREGSDV